MRRFILAVKRRLLHYRGPDPLRVIITGPPRSGTSLLARMVVAMGLSPGPREWLKPGDINNPEGYCECVPLMRTELEVLARFGGDRNTVCDFPPDWLDTVAGEGRLIRRIVASGGIQVYKGNMLMTLAPLYHSLFPRARWLYLERDPDATFKSERRFVGTGPRPDRAAWDELRARRLGAWQTSAAARQALDISFETLLARPGEEIERIARHLELPLTPARRQDCLAAMRRDGCDFAGGRA